MTYDNRMDDLFRTEAVQATSDLAFGSVRLRTEFAFDLMAIWSLVGLVCLLATLVFGNYSRTVDLVGFLELTGPPSTTVASENTREKPELVAHFVAPLKNIRAYNEGQLLPLVFQGLPMSQAPAMVGRVYAVKPVLGSANDPLGHCDIFVTVPSDSTRIVGRPVHLSAGIRVTSSVVVARHSLGSWLLKGGDS